MRVDYKVLAKVCLDCMENFRKTGLTCEKCIVDKLKVKQAKEHQENKNQKR